MDRIDKEKKKRLTKEAYLINGALYRGEFPPTKVNRRDMQYIKDYWAPFLQFDNQWSTNLIELTLAKITMLYDTMNEHKDDYEAKTRDKFYEAYTLGRYLLDHDFEDDAFTWLRANNTSYTYVYNKDNELIYKCEGDIFDDLRGDNDGKLYEWLKENNLTKKDIHLAYGGEWNNGNSEKENKKQLSKLFKQCQTNYKKTKEKYFKLLANLEEYL